jgi:hypothetical protein
LYRAAFLRLKPLQHLAAAASTAILALVLAVWAMQWLQAKSFAVNAELNALERRLPPKIPATSSFPPADFTQTLPQSVAHEDVVRDTSRFAQKAGVQIASLTIQKQAATASELGTVQFTIAAKADYQAAKTWLAELLARYPSLALQSLSLRAAPNEPARQEVRAVLLLFVKD